jgi:hypothetical protein
MFPLRLDLLNQFDIVANDKFQAVDANEFLSKARRASIIITLSTNAGEEKG